jgi:hypothetical protein
MTGRLTALLDRLAPVVWPTLRERYRADCCVAAAAILKQVFAKHGFSAEVVPVTVEIFNAAMDRLLRKAPLPDNREQREKLLDITGAWSVGILPPGPAPLAIRDARGGGYGGHLALHVEDVIIDAAIRQADRPHKGIVMPDMLVTEAKDLLAEGAAYLRVNDCTIVYRRIDDHSYRSAPDWNRRTTPYPETLRGILQRINQKAVSAR